MRRRYPPRKAVTCAQCDKPFLAHKSHRRYCDECRVLITAYLQRVRRARQRVSAVSCGQCSKAFTPRRSDAKFCSAACKQAAFRTRVTDTDLSLRRDKSTAVTSR